MHKQAPIHVLVVEDEAVNRDVVCHMLAHFGYRVSAVDDGYAALAFVSETPCDLVVMDCRMHDMDGLEATRRMRAGEAGPDGRSVPIIALTAQAFHADREACLAAGMNDFLSKPVDIDTLISAVEQWGRRRAEAATPDQAQAAAAGSPADASPPVFDQAVLAALPMVADGTQPEYGEVVLGLYFKSLPEFLAVIRKAVLLGDVPTAQRAAHSLKSSSAAVGALSMAACAAEAEAQLGRGNQDVSHLPSRFDTEFERLCHMLGRPHEPVPERVA
jgi:CheY-like chemotaxis protein/HPt (histidine-containing phosphotransfer) domain-containing protein